MSLSTGKGHLPEVMFSAYALNAANIGEMQEEITQARLAQLKAQQDLQEMNGNTAQFDAQQTYNGIHDQSVATKNSAIGSISAGATQGAAEFGSVGYEAVRSRNGTLKDDNKLAGKLKSWKEALNDTKASDVIAKGEAETPPKPTATPEEVAAAQERLDKISISEEPSKQDLDDIATVKGKQDSARKSPDVLDRLKERVKNDLEDVQKRIDSFNNETTRKGDQFRKMGQIGGDLARGVANMYQAQAQEDQALEQALGQQAKFADTSAKAATDLMSKGVDNLNQLMQSSNELATGMQSSNKS